MTRFSQSKNVSVAFLFPGQGAQYIGMGKDFYDAFPIARQTFEEADDILSFCLSKLIFEGPLTLLTETRHSQLAVFVNSAALLRTFQSFLPGLVPTVCAGLSLGEYTALFASKRLSFAETVRLVHVRSSLMNKACQKKSGKMAAVLGLSAEDVQSVIESLNPPHLVWAANFNYPNQTVISGTDEGVRIAQTTLEMRGAKRIIPLQVHGAFHSGLMQEAQNEFAPIISALTLQESSIPLIMNITGNWTEKNDQIKKYLTLQMTHAVQWERTIQCMIKKCLDVYLEIGCGKTLTNMNKKNGIKSSILSLEKISDLEQVIRGIEVLLNM